LNYFKSNNGQSAVEFAIVLPVFLLISLGLIQLGLIYVNVMLLKYSAYMTARVAAVYQDSQKRNNSAYKAKYILSAIQTTANKYNSNMLSNVGDSILDLAKNTAETYIQGNEVSISKEIFEKAKGEYIKVTITYNMQLKVPFVNKLFGLFQIKNYNILDTKTMAAYMGFPYYTLKSTAIMRIQ